MKFNRKQQWVLGIAAILSAFFILVLISSGGYGGSPESVFFLILIWIAAPIICWLLRA